MNEKEKKLKESQTCLAVQKNLMGFTGKLGVILKHLGEPIIDHREGGGELMNYSNREIHTMWRNDFWDDGQELPTFDAEDALGNSVEEPYSPEWTTKKKGRQKVSTNQIGWHFDGLNRGMHLEIKYWEERAHITVHHKGYLVYEEIMGELEAFVSRPAWEDLIEQLYLKARPKEQAERKQEKEERIQEATARKETWLQRMRIIWGI